MVFSNLTRQLCSGGGWADIAKRKVCTSQLSVDEIVVGIFVSKNLLISRLTFCIVSISWIVEILARDGSINNLSFFFVVVSLVGGISPGRLFPPRVPLFFSWGFPVSRGEATSLGCRDGWGFSLGTTSSGFPFP